MLDLSSILTVQEYVKKKGYTKLWLCPSLVSTGRIGGDPFLKGIECTSSSIPDQIKNKKVRTTFNDCGFHCIIWENDEDLGCQYKFLYEEAEGIE